MRAVTVTRVHFVELSIYGPDRFYIFHLKKNLQVYRARARRAAAPTTCTCMHTCMYMCLLHVVSLSLFHFGFITPWLSQITSPPSTEQ